MKIKNLFDDLKQLGKKKYYFKKWRRRNLLF